MHKSRRTVIYPILFRKFFWLMKLTTQLNHPETPVNVLLNLHVKSPCNHGNIDRGVNDANSINDITQPIIAKSGGNFVWRN